MGLTQYLLGTKKEIDSDIAEKVKTEKDHSRYWKRWFTYLVLESATAVTFMLTDTPAYITIPALLDAGWRVASPNIRGLYRGMTGKIYKDAVNDNLDKRDLPNNVKYMAVPGLVGLLREICSKNPKED